MVDWLTSVLSVIRDIISDDSLDLVEGQLEHLRVSLGRDNRQTSNVGLRIFVSRRKALKLLDHKLVFARDSYTV